MAVLTYSGVASVSSAYYDVARTMGASTWFLIRRVAVPAALPSVFVGVFMGLSASFSVLVRGGDARRQGRARLVHAVGSGLGRLCNMYAALI